MTVVSRAAVRDAVEELAREGTEEITSHDVADTLGRSPLQWVHSSIGNQLSRLSEEGVVERVRNGHAVKDTTKWRIVDPDASADPELRADGGIPAWAEVAENGYRCTACDAQAADFPVGHVDGCVYANDLVADGGVPTDDLGAAGQSAIDRLDEAAKQVRIVRRENAVTEGDQTVLSDIETRIRDAAAMLDEWADEEDIMTDGGRAPRDSEVPVGPAKNVRLAVNRDHLELDNPLHYLVSLATEARRYDGAWDGDAEQAAQWAVAQWCQEIGWAPDLTDYDAGETVDRADDLDNCEAVFYEYVTDGGTQGAIDNDFDQAERTPREHLEAELEDVDAATHAGLGVGDVAIDLVTRQPLMILGKSADTLVDHYEREEFDLATYKQHPFLPVQIDDTVFECAFIGGVDDLHSFSRSYDYPAGRLARVPFELAVDDGGDD